LESGNFDGVVLPAFEGAMNAAAQFSPLAAKPRTRKAAPTPTRKAKSYRTAALIIGLGFVVMITVGIWLGRDILLPRRGAVEADSRQIRAELLQPLDSRSAFAEKQIGSLLFSTNNTDVCRRALFDNRTGVVGETSQVYCMQQQETPAERPGQDRANSMLKAFRR
jgi:hypothetical protein